MSWYPGRQIQKSKITQLEKSLKARKRRQEGIEFPSASKQDQILIIRFNIAKSILDKGNFNVVRSGLRELCTFFEEIDNKNIKFIKLLPDGQRDLVPLSEFNFSVTLGFGKGFFEKLRKIIKNYPKHLKEMPNHIELGDAIPYVMQQTDFIIQLCSNSEDVNSRVFQNNTDKPLPKNGLNQINSTIYYQQKKNTGDTTGIPNEIYTAISDWVEIVDMHVGFQRIDGTSLLGFNDGISNPRRLLNDIVWTTTKEEDRKFTDGTYMVFQKIQHDLDKWRELDQDEQEKLIGRSKGTGLLLGTLPKEEDQKLGADLKSDNRYIRTTAQKKWKKLFNEQQDPDRKFFDSSQKQYKNIQMECPVWSHVRKTNPRGFQGAERHLIYRRGYLFMDLSGPGVFNSGLLFICFQKDIEKGFEYIKKVFFNNSIPTKVAFQNDTYQTYSTETIKNLRPISSSSGNKKITIYNTNLNHKTKTKAPKSHFRKTDLTFQEHISSNKYSSGQIPGTLTQGGGYYFIPPIPNKRIANLSEQFFV